MFCFKKKRAYVAWKSISVKKSGCFREKRVFLKRKYEHGRECVWGVAVLGMWHIAVWRNKLLNVNKL